MNSSFNLGDRIKFFRELRGLSQESVAFAANISITYYGQLERNQKTNPSLAVVSTLCDIFQVSLSEFFADADNTNDSFYNENELSMKIQFLVNEMSDSEKEIILNSINNMISFRKC